MHFNGDFVDGGSFREVLSDGVIGEEGVREEVREGDGVVNEDGPYGQDGPSGQRCSLGCSWLAGFSLIQIWILKYML